jgi:hypothetical protein
MRIEKSIKLARISKSNGAASKRERLAAIEEAQDAQVTHLDYLRAHLMLEIAEGNNHSAQNWFRYEPEQQDSAT